jgi:hypothetical protein
MIGLEQRKQNLRYILQIVEREEGKCYQMLEGFYRIEEWTTRSRNNLKNLFMFANPFGQKRRCYQGKEIDDGVKTFETQIEERNNQF